MCPTTPHFEISVHTCNISFLGLRPARGGNWGKRGLLKEFLEHCVGGSLGTTRSCMAVSQQRRAPGPWCAHVADGSVVSVLSNYGNP